MSLDGREDSGSWRLLARPPRRPRETWNRYRLHRRKDRERFVCRTWLADRVEAFAVGIDVAYTSGGLDSEVRTRRIEKLRIWPQVL